MPIDDVPAPTIDDEDTLVRFVYDSDKFRPDRVLPGAFLPSYEDQWQRLETSVCRDSMCDIARVWHLARTQRSDKNVKGAANFKAASATATGLSCLAAPVDGYGEHAVVIKWPENKSEQRLIAGKLSQASRPRVVDT